MDTHILKEMISVIRAEQKRRTSLLKNEDPDFSYDQWLFTDGPFINELCLSFLVTLRHQVERELVWLLSKMTDDGREISSHQYIDNVRNERKKLRKPRGWDSLHKRLNSELCNGFHCFEALRLLTNSYKHNPHLEPDNQLITKLNLAPYVPYASLPESYELEKGLALFIGLQADADYCDITERFVEIANEFISDIENRNNKNLSKVKWGAVSLNPNNFAR